MPGILYANDLVLCDELEEDIRAVLGRFVEMYRKRGLKVNACKRKGIVLRGEEGLECEVSVNMIRFEHVSEFKYLGCVLKELGTDELEYRRKVVIGRRAAGAIRSLV